MSEFITENTLELTAIGISLAAILGAIYVYFVHEKKLNTQQKQINEFQIKKIKEEEDDNKKAQIECNIIKNSSIHKLNELVIYNKGRSIANNIMIEIDYSNSLELCIDKGFLPYPKLLPQHSFKICYIMLVRDAPYNIVKMTWDDDFEQRREMEQSLVL